MLPNGVILWILHVCKPLTGIGILCECEAGFLVLPSMWTFKPLTL